MEDVKEYQVYGMTCANCVARVQKAAEKLPQVKSAQVNLATEVLRLEVAKDFDSKSLEDAISAAGYSAVAKSDKEGRSAFEQRYWGLLREEWMLLASTLLTLPLVVPMILEVMGVSNWQLPGVWQLVLATPIQFVLGFRFYKAGFKALRSGSANMDILVALGSTAAYALSIYLLVTSAHGHAHLYFESSAVIITLVRLGKYLESRAKRKTGEALRQMESLLPDEVTVIRKSGDEKLALSRVKKNDKLRILPGSRIPLDAVLEEGEALVDESLMTGESAALEKRPGDALVGGSLNLDGQLVIKVTKLKSEGRLGQMIAAMEEAQAWKAPIQKLIDRVTAVFVPIVVLIALFVMLGWGLSTGNWEQAILNAVATLVIACPCALGLATPTSIMVGTGLAAKSGILINEPEALEQASKIRAVVFDKTGTLTEGKPKLSKLIVAKGEDPQKVRSLVYSLQNASGHVLAKAVKEKLSTESDIELLGLEKLREEAGRGVGAIFESQSYFIGSHRSLAEEGLTTSGLQSELAEISQGGYSLSYLWNRDQKKLLAVLAFEDQVRETAIQALDELNLRGLDVYLLSGDLEKNVSSLAAKLGIPNYKAEVRPDEKANFIRELEKIYPVAMVGDGVNDAPALATASLSLAMSTGSDVAMSTASMTLMGADPRLVPAALEISERTYSKMKQNLFWAFLYNIIAIPAAAMGYLTPMIAGAAMAMSSISVVLSALSLGRRRPRILDVPAGVKAAIAALFAIVSLAFIKNASAVEASAKVKSYELVATREKVNLSGKKEVDFALLLNGKLPAPTLEFTEGEIAEIKVVNKIPGEELSIHWHGLLLPPEMDGVPYVNTPPIHSGESYTFRFLLRQNGTYWYHSHTQLQEQKGLYGAFIIHPKKPDLKVDRDLSVVISDWSDENADQIIKNLRKDGDYYLYKKNSIRSYGEALMKGSLSNMLKNEWMRMGGMDLSDVGYDAFLMNGKQKLELPEIKPGETVRLRLINAAASSYFYITSSFPAMKLIAVDGQDIESQEVNQILMGMAETYDILVKMPSSGQMEVRATVQDVTGSTSIILGQGALTPATEIPKPDPYALMEHDHGGGHSGHSGHGAATPATTPATHDHSQHNHGGHHDHSSHAHHGHSHNAHAGHAMPAKAEALDWNKLKAKTPKPFPSNARRHDVKLVLGGDMERYIWHINGKAIHEDRTIFINEGDVVSFELVNETMMHHPMHLHGHFFRVVNAQGDNAALRHTVDVPPFETRKIEFLADEKGEWMLHCHNLYHMKSGMARVVRYSDYKPSAEIEALQHHDPHLHVHTYANASVELSPEFLTARGRVTRFWDEIELRAEGTYEAEDGHGKKWHRELDLQYKRFTDNYFHWALGLSDHHEEQRLEAGAGLLLPLLIESRLVVDSKGKLRLDLEKKFQWTSTIFSDLEIRLRDGFDPEIESSLMYGPSWNWAAGVRAKNDLVNVGFIYKF